MQKAMLKLHAKLQWRHSGACRRDGHAARWLAAWRWPSPRNLRRARCLALNPFRADGPGSPAHHCNGLLEPWASSGIVVFRTSASRRSSTQLTRAQIAAEIHPFCTIDPNVGVVPVPGSAAELADIVKP